MRVQLTDVFGGTRFSCDPLLRNANGKIQKALLVD
jgi:hypothetical protein